MNADENLLTLTCGILFIVAFIPALVGGVMFMGRKQLGWTVAQSRRYLYWERSLWIGGTILLTLGLSLFVRLLQIAGEDGLSQIGLTGFLLGAFLIIVVEGYGLDGQNWSPYLVRLSVILLLLSQAAIGLAMLQVQALPQWIGWVTVVWNLGWFVVTSFLKDPYYPALYYIMPLIIGVMLVFFAR